MGRFLTRLIDMQAGWARPFGDFNHRWLSAVFRPIRPIKDLLHGTWLGHPLHSASTDLPIGVIYFSVLFDVLDMRSGADILLVGGVVLMLLSALSGLADYADTDGRARIRATVHATLMILTVAVLAISVVLRAGDPTDRTLAIVLSVVGAILLTAGAFVGGDVVYALGNMVSRHAFRGAGAKWLPLEVPGDGTVPEGQPIKAKLGINSLVLVREGAAIHALHEQCAHAGGPLSEGRIVDGCIECPWHGSRFGLSDGHARRGPTVYDQPAYEVRATESGGLEARRVQE
jgi:nitrite reductase/ring-hydroxylating ferredoxin subunit/uncharacterized membrane protein